MEIEGFDIHEVNRLIQREQIPGFKMLPEERAYLEKYREILREAYTADRKGITSHENQGKTVSTEADVEVEVKAKRAKRSNKTKTPIESE